MSEPVHIHSGPAGPAFPNDVSAVAWLQSVTLAWMAVECSVSLSAAKRSRSVALLAFGSDSLVELLSATVVVLQFVPVWRVRQKWATQVAAALLFALAGVVALTSFVALARGAQPEISPAGMAITTAALFMMPVLATLKRRKARELNNSALAADAVQSATCAYLAALTLCSLAANAVFHITWIDPVGALAALPFLIAEGHRTWKGESCGCC